VQVGTTSVRVVWINWSLHSKYLYFDGWCHRCIRFLAALDSVTAWEKP